MSINDQRWIKIELTLSTLRHFFYGKIPAEFFMSETSKIEELVNAIILIAPWIATWLYPAPLENGIPCKILGKQFKSVLTDDKQLDSSVKHACMAHPPHPHHRSVTPKFVTPTAPSCIDNSWRSTTLPGADSASSNQTLPFQNEHEWVLEKLR